MSKLKFTLLFIFFFCSASISNAYNPDFTVTNFNANYGYFKVDHTSFPSWAIETGYGCQNLYLKNVNTQPFNTSLNVLNCHVAYTDEFETTLFSPITVPDGTYEIVLNDAHYTNLTNHNWLMSQAFNVAGGVKTTDTLSPTVKISLLNLNTNTGVFTIDPLSFPADYFTTGGYQCGNVGLKNLETRDSFGLNIPSCTSALTEETATTYFMPLSIPDGTYELVFPDSSPGTLITQSFILVNGEAILNNQNISLNIPLIKQTSEPWGSKEYDSANVWNPLDPRIYTWGCALTSAAMVFKYHGLNELPGNKTLDPGTLNDWLKKQKDGYVGNGLVNWLALSRLSKQVAGLNHIKSFNALEFTKTHSNDNNLVITDLENNIPDILGVPGHFIVAKGAENNVISINDPGFNRSSLSDYGNTFSTINRFSPSNTDLSYIMLTIDPSINIQLKDSQGNDLGEEYIEEPINNLITGIPAGNPIKIVMLPKPSIQDFEIILSSLTNSDYELGIYKYDKFGDVLVSTEEGNIMAGQEITIPFHFDAQAEIYPRKISFGKFGSDLNKGYHQGKINYDLYLALNNLYDEMQIFNRKKQDNLTLNKLIAFEKLLTSNKISLNPDLYNTLIYNVNYLQTHL